MAPSTAVRVHGSAWVELLARFDLVGFDPVIHPNSDVRIRGLMAAFFDLDHTTRVQNLAGQGCAGTAVLRIVEERLNLSLGVGLPGGAVVHIVVVGLIPLRLEYLGRPRKGCAAQQQHADRSHEFFHCQVPLHAYSVTIFGALGFITC